MHYLDFSMIVFSSNGARVDVLDKDISCFTWATIKKKWEWSKKKVHYKKKNIIKGNPVFSEKKFCVCSFKEFNSFDRNQQKETHI